MSDMPFTQLNDDYAVAPQLTADDVRTASQAGYRTLLINRPDAELSPEQPSSEEMIGLAESLGMKAVYLPIISGGPTEGEVEEFAIVFEELPKPVLAYCRSGNRSATAYALAAARES
ncbi:MAG: TIGR01244 family sulfur transferase [Alcaligenaceae bacterium]|nr:TIGR01244 family sulfur transferase [Alcaligenaceae bacterium]